LPERYSGTWPDSGMMLNGVSYRLRTSAPRTSGGGSSSWPTPNASDCHGHQYQYSNGNHAKKTLTLVGKARKWPTPRVRGLLGGTGSQEMLLSLMASGKMTKEEFLAIAQRKTWPTPTVQDSKNKGGPSQFKRNSIPLNAIVKMFPTPKAQNAKAPCPHGQGGPGLQEAVFSEEKIVGQLNPMFVEWLMGFPINWTESESSATPSSRKSRKR